MVGNNVNLPCRQVLHWWRSVLALLQLLWFPHLLHRAGNRAGRSLHERQHLGLQGDLRLGVVHHRLQGPAHQRLWVTDQRAADELQPRETSRTRDVVVRACRRRWRLHDLVGPLRWHQRPHRRLHAGIQREVSPPQEGLRVLERKGLRGQHSADSVSVHPGWLHVVRQPVSKPPYLCYMRESKSLSAGIEHTSNVITSRMISFRSINSDICFSCWFCLMNALI